MLDILTKAEKGLCYPQNTLSALIFGYLCGHQTHIWASVNESYILKGEPLTTGSHS